MTTRPPSRLRVEREITAADVEGRWCVRCLPEALTPDGADEETLLDALRLLGVPSSRDGGKPVWPVHPRGANAGTFSVRTGYADLHTDSQYRPDPERWVALYCVRPARHGGESLALSGVRALALLRAHPDGERIEALLREPAFRWQVPAIFPEGDQEPCPILNGGSIRWRRDNLIASGHHLWAADAFHALLGKTEVTVRLRLTPGDLLILDNHRAMHGRTHFEDADRLLLRVRIW